MIKKSSTQNIRELMDIWLHTNISAHAFIDKSYWEKAFDTVQTLLPESDIFIYEEAQIIKGFIGITDGFYIAGLFVRENHQSKGIGRQLLDYCKRLYPSLALDVFVENKSAVRFYQRNGFTIHETKNNATFNHAEHYMVWVS